MIKVSGNPNELASLLPEIAPEVVAEWNASQWLAGKLAPKGTAHYDVWNCPNFPGMTFQVKYSALFPSRGSGNHAPSWRWWQANGHPDPILPHVYVLCGDGEYQANWFVMPRRVFLRRATKTEHSSRKSGALLVQARSSHESWIWHYYCSDPERNLICRVQEQIESIQPLLSSIDPPAESES